MVQWQEWERNNHNRPWQIKLEWLKLHRSKKLAISLKFVQGCLFAYNWNLEMGKALNGSFDVGPLEFRLIMQISEGIDAVYGQNNR